MGNFFNACGKTTCCEQLHLHLTSSYLHFEPRTEQELRQNPDQHLLTGTQEHMVYFSCENSGSSLSLINNLLVTTIPYVLLQKFCLDSSRYTQSYQHIRQLDRYWEEYCQLCETPDLQLWSLQVNMRIIKRYWWTKSVYSSSSKD